MAESAVGAEDRRVDLLISKRQRVDNDDALLNEAASHAPSSPEPSPQTWGSSASADEAVPEWAESAAEAEAERVDPVSAAPATPEETAAAAVLDAAALQARLSEMIAAGALAQRFSDIMAAGHAPGLGGPPVPQLRRAGLWRNFAVKRSRSAVRWGQSSVDAIGRETREGPLARQAWSARVGAGTAG
ncbi:unnamed protein product [Prorocentrum cordatum]|uniref:Uncharacterized protein n=1 Tax=Prorocentrum cordatum TaxID=2364126 RepID=A0ABN9U8M4_9DINO|nr:unnamed protein product [Polarella glacialis]